MGRVNFLVTHLHACFDGDQNWQIIDQKVLTPHFELLYKERLFFISSLRLHEWKFSRPPLPFC